MLPAGEETPLIGNRTQSLSSSGPGLLQVSLYHQPNSCRPAPETSGSLAFTVGEYSAEELCVAAAKACGILPACHGLFCLATEDLSGWFPPSHVFSVSGSTNQVAVYRIRFFFPDWFGPTKSRRWGLADPQGSPVLDGPTLDYLFAQSRSDFLQRRMERPLMLDTQETCLGLAVLDVLRMARERKQTLAELFQSFSYKACLPESLRCHVQAQGFLTRQRIRRQFGRSLRKVGRLQTDPRLLKLMYLVELQGLEESVAGEAFLVRSPGEGQGAQWLLHVSAEKGISTCPEGGKECPHQFCDFPEIADMTVEEDSQAPGEHCVVSLTKMDGRILEVAFPSRAQALSFMALVDGYFRLLVDSGHFFCKEVAPPRLLEDLAEGCHGPITSEFARAKLGTGGQPGGTYLLRRSPEDFDSYLLSVCLEAPTGKDFKNLMIQKNRDGTFSTPGVAAKFCSLWAMLKACQCFTLQAGQETVRLGSLCPPRPREKSNLLIVRGGRFCHQLSSSPVAQRHAVHQMTFHKIQAEHLSQCENLAQGTFTRVYRGLKRDPQEGPALDRDPGGHLSEVALKVLDQSHARWVEPFLEAASLIGRLSHKHLVLLHGVSMGATHVMVQEYVQHGALDAYLRRTSGRVGTSWKLQVAKQLGYALAFLEDQKVTHGNVSAKKVLLAREGDVAGGLPPFVKLGDPGISPAALPREVLLHRIPWVAPECVWDPQRPMDRADQWGFGATLWEIFNGGHMPLSALDAQEKLRFYQECQDLPPLPWTELAELVAQCMRYRPEWRPSFRALLRELNGIISSDYELLSDVLSARGCGGHVDAPRGHDPTLFEERHLRYISILGKGNFGSVELCRYDPLGDSTGELVAVKRLQHGSEEGRHEFEKEIAILRALQHDFVVAYRGVCYSRGQNGLRLVMEYLPNGCLRNYLQENHERLDHKKLLLYAWQTCKGMEYLGSRRYIHRDLAARNILVESKSRVKIGDFGLAKILPQGKEYYVVQEPGQSPIFWYAPESLSDSVFSPESDVWSFGVVLYELFTYGSRSRGPSQEFLHLMGPSSPSVIVCRLLELLKAEKRLPAPAGCPTEVFALMESCWSFLPSKRPRFCKLAPQIEALREGRCKARG